METCIFPKDRALVNVQKSAFCVQSHSEENIFAIQSLNGHVNMC